MSYTVTTWPATVLSGTSAKLLADFSGDSTGFSFYFTYGTSSVSAKQTPLVSLSNFSDFTYTLTGLSVNTSYIFKAVAVKGATIVNGRSFNFTTFDEEPGSPGTDPVPIPDDPDPPGGGVIVRPAVTPTTPSTASAENVDWKVNSWWNNVTKGPWAFEKCPNKPRYNEGSSIATQLDPTWDMAEFSGEQITDGHDPCGYWPDGSGRFLPPEIETITATNGVGECIAWAGTLGGQYGRFVKGRTYGQVHYSDDGGFTWTRCDGGLFPAGNNIEFAIYTQGYFFVVSWGGYTGGAIGRSADGITWTIINKTIGNLHYSSTFNKFFANLGTYGRYAGYSSDLCSNWTQRTAMNSYGYYTGNTTYLNKHYFLAYNYNYMWESTDGYTWVQSSATPWSLNPSSARRGVFLADNHLYYSNCKFDGTSWTSTGIPFRYGEYKKGLGYVCIYSYTVKWAADDFLASKVVHTDSGNTLRDVCWGNDRWVAVSPSRVVVGIIKPGYIEVSTTPAIYTKNYMARNWKTKFIAIKEQVPWKI